MEPLDALATATSTFLAVLDQVGPDQLGNGTPCEGWDVADLLGHLVAGDEITVALLDGASADEARDLLDRERGGDVVAACRASLADQQARLVRVDDWDAIVHHLIGDVPASQLLRFRTGDLTLHAWDLATALGVDAGIPDELAGDVLEAMLPMAPFIAEVGLFGTGPSGTVPEDAPVTLRLLDFTGRRPV
jgi:uncharacterized protein (TIGR03086 family)